MKNKTQTNTYNYVCALKEHDIKLSNTTFLKFLKRHELYCEYANYYNLTVEYFMVDGDFAYGADMEGVTQEEEANIITEFYKNKNYKIEISDDNEHILDVKKIKNKNK